MKANALISIIFIISLGWFLHWNANYVPPKPLTLEAKIEMLEKELSEKNSEISNLNKKISFLTENEESLKKSLNELSEQDKNLLADLKKQKFEQEQALNSLKEKETEIVSLKSKMSSTETKLLEVDKKYQELLEKNKTKEAAIVAKSDTTKIKNLENKILELEKTIEKLKKDTPSILTFKEPWLNPPLIIEKPIIIEKPVVEKPKEVPAAEAPRPQDYEEKKVDEIKKLTFFEKIKSQWEKFWKIKEENVEPPKNWAEIYKQNLKTAENKKYPESCLKLIKKMSEQAFENSDFEEEETQKEWIKRWFFNSQEGTLYFQLTIYKEIPPHLDNAHSFDFLVFANDKHVFQFTGTWEGKDSPRWRDLDVIGYLPGKWESWLAEVSQ